MLSDCLTRCVLWFTGKGCGSDLSSPRKKTSPAILAAALPLLFLSAALIGCELVPARPEAVFIVYRDRMKSQNLAEARKLLTKESSGLALDLTARYKLVRPPEETALLNILDPQSSPVATLSEGTFALIQVRTLKGGLRLIRLVRENAHSPWHINITEELSALQTFLEAQAALESMRERAGDYAASLRAFSDQLDRMNVTDDPEAKAQVQKPPPKPRSSRLDKDRKRP